MQLDSTETNTAVNVLKEDVENQVALLWIKELQEVNTGRDERCNTLFNPLNLKAQLVGILAVPGINKQGFLSCCYEVKDL